MNSETYRAAMAMIKSPADVAALNRVAPGLMTLAAAEAVQRASGGLSMDRLRELRQVINARHDPEQSRAFIPLSRRRAWRSWCCR